MIRENQNNDIFHVLETIPENKVEYQETDNDFDNIENISKNKNFIESTNLNLNDTTKRETKNGFLSKKRKLSRPKIKGKEEILKLFSKCKKNIFSFINKRIKNRFNKANFKLPLKQLNDMLKIDIETSLKKDLGSFFNKKVTKLGEILNKEKNNNKKPIHLLNELFKMKLEEIFLMYANNDPFIKKKNGNFYIQNTRKVLNDNERKEIKNYLDNYENNKMIQSEENINSSNIKFLISNEGFFSTNEESIQINKEKEKKNIFKVEIQKKHDKFYNDNLLNFLMRACLDSFNIFIKNIISQTNEGFEINDPVIKNKYLKNNNEKKNFSSKSMIKIYAESFKKNSKEKDEIKREENIRKIFCKNELLDKLFNMEYKEGLYYYVNKKVHPLSKINEDDLKGFKTFDEDEKCKEIKDKSNEKIHDLAKDLFDGKLNTRKSREKKMKKNKKY